MSLQFRRGTDAERLLITPAPGEPVWTTDTSILYVGDGVSVGGLPINSGGGSGVTEIIAGSNITVNTSTGAVTINAVVPASTSTFDSVQIGTGTYKMFIGESPNPFNNQFYITGNEESDDRLYFDQWQLVQFNNTVTVQSSTIGLNTGTGARSFGYGFMPYNANNMKIETPNNGASMFFALKNPSGVAKNVGFSRQGNIVLQNGGVFNAFPAGVSVSALDGGIAQLQTTTSTGDITVTALVVADNSTGVSLFVDNYDAGTDTDVFYEVNLSHNGVFTVPKDLVVTTTATVATLKFGDGSEMTTAPTAGVAGDQSVYTTSSVTFDTLAVTNTATANEVVVGPDLVAIKSQGYNIIGVDNNWRVGNVLEVGSSGNGYITSTGDYPLTLQTSANDGPGGSIVIGSGDGAGVQVFNGPSQTYEVASLNTFTNTLRSSQFEVRDNDYNLQAQINSNGSTHYGNYHNFGNVDATAQINSQGTGDLRLIAGSDASVTGGIIAYSVAGGGVDIFGPANTSIATFNTSSVTINTNTTISTLLIGKNNSSRTITGATDYPNTMLVANQAGASSGIMFSTRNGSNANRNLLIDRNANIWLHFGSGIQSTTAGGLSLFCAANSSTAAVSIAGGSSQGVVLLNSTGVNLIANNPITFDQYKINLSTSTGVTTLPGLLTLGVYTAAALTAITGVVGQVAIVSDSASGGNPNGMMAFWDTSNARWSYVHDNTAV